MIDDPDQTPEIKVYDLTEAEATLAPKRVLMLEDEVEFSAIVKDLLQTQGYTVTCVSSGVEGFKCVMAEDYDAIICDLLMPTLPGDMFYLAVEKTKPKLCKRFIFISGHRADPRWEAFIKRVNGLILWKPFPMKDLLAAIDKVLAL
jgi:DNA-binding response OmpR family regulator